jgi:hypothetical protein
MISTSFLYWIVLIYLFFNLIFYSFKGARKIHVKMFLNDRKKFQRVSIPQLASRHNQGML